MLRDFPHQIHERHVSFLCVSYEFSSFLQLVGPPFYILLAVRLGNSPHSVNVSLQQLTLQEIFKETPERLRTSCDTSENVEDVEDGCWLSERGSVETQ